MPILEVTVVLKKGEALPAGLAAHIADLAASALGAAPGRTWVRLTALPADQYAEDGGGPPEGVSPVFVTVLKSEFRDLRAMRKEAESLTKAIASATKRPSTNVHVVYEAPARGRISFGGNLLT